MWKDSGSGYQRYDYVDIQNSLWALIKKCPGDKKEKENALRDILLTQ